jgi:hypothetical protein
MPSPSETLWDGCNAPSPPITTKRSYRQSLTWIRWPYHLSSSTIWLTLCPSTSSPVYKLSNADEVRQAASTYIRRYTDNILNSGNQSSINIMTDRLLRSLRIPAIPMKLKRNIVSTLQHILVKDTKSIIRNAFTPNIISTLDQTLRCETPSS